MSASDMPNSPMPKNRDSVEQDQFLTILSREDALARKDGQELIQIGRAHV